MLVDVFLTNTPPYQIQDPGHSHQSTSAIFDTAQYRGRSSSSPEQRDLRGETSGCDVIREKWSNYQLSSVIVIYWCAPEVPFLFYGIAMDTSVWRIIRRLSKREMSD